MKKVLAVVLSCIMLISAMPIVFAEDQPQIIVSSAKAKAGEPVVVTISISENPGITAMSLSMSYNSNALALSDVHTESVFSGMSPSFSPSLDDNPYSLQWSSGVTNIITNETTVFVTLTFNVLEDCAEGEYPIEISYEEDNIFNTSFSLIL